MKHEKTCLCCLWQLACWQLMQLRLMLSQAVLSVNKSANIVMSTVEAFIGSASRSFYWDQLRRCITALASNPALGSSTLYLLEAVHVTEKSDCVQWNELLSQDTAFHMLTGFSVFCCPSRIQTAVGCAFAGGYAVHTHYHSSLGHRSIPATSTSEYVRHVQDD